LSGTRCPDCPDESSASRMADIIAKLRELCKMRERKTALLLALYINVNAAEVVIAALNFAHFSS